MVTKLTWHLVWLQSAKLHYSIGTIRIKDSLHGGLKGFLMCTTSAVARFFFKPYTNVLDGSLNRHRIALNKWWAQYLDFYTKNCFLSFLKVLPQLSATSGSPVQKEQIKIKNYDFAVNLQASGN